MPTIFSTEVDFSTSDVVNWLIYFDQENIRINGNETLEEVYIDLINDIINIIDIYGNKYVANDFKKKIWYRHGLLSMKEYTKINSMNFNVANGLNKFIKNERIILNQYLVYFLNKLCSYSLNRPTDYCINKLIVLREAVGLGIIVPDTIISTRKEQVLDFLKKHKNGIITKPISEVMRIDDKEAVYKMYTEQVDDTIINALPDIFFPSLFQEKVEKLFEIRTFYLDGDFYSMAIFSQSSEQTKTDFRRYDPINPNRTVPFNLDFKLKTKVRKLMKTMHLNSGSIDFIYGIDGEIYFLEVNPVGQFGMVSHPCNYYLEKIIAQKLTDP